jgi:hypothetical protein
MTEVDWNKLGAEVEAVARAMYAARIGNSRNCYEFDELNSEGQYHVFDALIIEAKAAIQALAFPAIKAERDAKDATIRALQEEKQTVRRLAIKYHGLGMKGAAQWRVGLEEIALLMAEEDTPND